MLLSCYKTCGKGEGKKRRNMCEKCSKQNNKASAACLCGLIVRACTENLLPSAPHNTQKDEANKNSRRRMSPKGH